MGTANPRSSRDHVDGGAPIATAAAEDCGPAWYVVRIETLLVGDSVYEFDELDSKANPDAEPKPDPLLVFARGLSTVSSDLSIGFMTIDAMLPADGMLGAGAAAA